MDERSIGLAKRNCRRRTLRRIGGGTGRTVDTGSRARLGSRTIDSLAARKRVRQTHRSKTIHRVGRNEGERLGFSSRPQAASEGIKRRDGRRGEELKEPDEACR